MNIYSKNAFFLKKKTIPCKYWHFLGCVVSWASSQVAGIQKPRQIRPESPPPPPPPPAGLLSACLARIVALVHQHPANMAAMATAPCFPATPGLPARGAVAARSRMAAGGSRSQRRRSSSGVFLCRSSTTGSSRMEDYNTAMKRMMRNPYEYHHDLGPYQSFFLVYALLMLPR